MYTARRLLTSAALVAFAVSFVQAAKPNMVPDYEVKLLMDPAVVLGPDHKLTPTVLETFSMPTSVTKLNNQFLDTNEQTMYNAGWSPRIRKVEKVNDFDLTYKKRYPIVDDDIDGALTLANEQGFDASDTNWAAQVEWGYMAKTLSISNKDTASDSGYSGMELPDLRDSRDMMIDHAPGKFNDWLYPNWGIDNLEISRIYGPVLAKRSTGTWSGLKLYIEVWPLLDETCTFIEYIVEASFKTTSRETASTKHDELIVFLESKGWFLPKDALKTAIIMRCY